MKIKLFKKILLVSKKYPYISILKCSDYKYYTKYKKINEKDVNRTRELYTINLYCKTITFKHPKQLSLDTDLNFIGIRKHKDSGLVLLCNMTGKIDTVMEFHVPSGTLINCFDKALINNININLIDCKLIDKK